MSPFASPRIYVDTTIYCDLAIKNPVPHVNTSEPRWKSARDLLRAVNDDRVVLAASALVEAEVGCLVPVRDGAPDLHEQVRGWFTAPSTKWTDVDRFLAHDAIDLAAEWGSFAAKGKKLGGADAIHLAAAVRLRCDYLMTQDGGFPIGQTVNGVKVMRPEIVWEVTLEDELEEHITREAEAENT